MRAAALHALARVAGAERGDAVLPARAEDALRAAVYAGAASPAHALLGFLRQPFPDLHVAAYKCARADSAPSVTPWGYRV